jgi:hypothetical protein
MNKKKHLFYEKIQCIYNNITKKDTHKFTELFFIKNGKASWDNRKSYLLKKWIRPKNKTINSRMFKSEYEKYPFSRLAVNGRRLFEGAEEFIQIEIEPFCKRIKSYLHAQVQLDSVTDTEYRYMYVFNLNGVRENNNIDYYEIEYTKTNLPNELGVYIKPPKHKSLLEIEPYHGVFKYQNNKIILRFENRDDYISAIFNTDLINKHTKYLIGVGIGIADINQKIPVAKKVLLTKEKIEDSEELYLILNETEIVSAEENSYKFKHNDRDFNPSHLEKYITKIERLNRLFKKLSEQQNYSSFYEQLAFKEFSAINNIFQKIKEHHPYYINYRKRVLDILLKSHPHEQYNAIYMVMPIYQEDNIFAHLSSKALILQKELQLLSNKVKIEIIFVIENCQEAFSHEFRAFLSKVQELIEIRFAFKGQIENEVNSIDFLFTDKKNFVVSKFLRVDNPVFNLFQDKTTIDEHEAMYRKIHNRSMGYDAFIKDKNQLCSVSNSVVGNLVGEWHFYIYGSKNILENIVVISVDGRVECHSQNQGLERGVIINKEYQSIILLEDDITKRVLTIVFDHQPHKIQDAFLVKIIGKQYKSDFDILTIGLFSRKSIKTSKVQEILGDVDDIRILEDNTIGGNLADYLSD